VTPAPRLARRGALLAAALVLAGCSGPAEDAPTVEVFLPPGSTFDQITDSLVARGVVRDRRWFRLTARVAGFDRKLKAGYYELRQGERPLVVLRTLAAGTEKTVRFTFPEGSTIIDLASLAQARLGLEPDSVLAAARDSSLIEAVGADAPSLEGFLYPETYFVSRMITARGLIQEMTKQFQRAWDPAWDNRRAAAGLSRDQLVAMASIVEGEARVEEERPVIAAVYLNRLRLRMPLQADPTVQYAIQLTTGARKSRLLERDYRFPSPYNTYLHPGLPPGPVGAPSRASIEAVLAPADVPYLFFVAQPDGRHVFTRTYGQHLQAIARIRQVEREMRRQARADSAAAR
jgi:UPF0755 protein